MLTKSLPSSDRPTSLLAKFRNNRVLGVDPGFDRVGIAVMENDKLLFSKCLETNRKLPHSERLVEVGQQVREVINEWSPDSLAIEELFFNKNTTNAMKVAEARGIILYESALAKLKIYPYSPQAIKLAVTGYGKADKSAVENMVRKLAKLDEVKRLDDELDAIALCITHLATRRVIW